MVNSKALITLSALALLGSSFAYSDTNTVPKQPTIQQLPARPISPYQNIDIPDRPPQLSIGEQTDLEFLIQAAKQKEKEFYDQAGKVREENHELLAKMPIARTQDELITDAVTGAIAESDQFDANQNKIAGNFYYILISSSLSDSELLNTMRSYKDRKDVVFVIQGVKYKEDLLEELSHFQQLVLDSASNVTVNLDPTIFKRYNVTSVPTIIHEFNGEMVARVSGITNTQYLKDKKGDLGVAGPVKDIAEANFLDLIEEGIANLDFEKMKKNALNDYWSNQKLREFPEVIRRSMHMVDPSVIIPHDIVSPNGQIIARKGRINPLSVTPFQIKLIIFDARSFWQRELAKQQFSNTPKGITPILITTNVYGNGWQTFKDATQTYGKTARLYLIQPGMAERFGIEKVPSIVTADEKNFIVNEYSQEDVVIK